MISKVPQHKFGGIDHALAAEGFRADDQLEVFVEGTRSRGSIIDIQWPYPALPGQIRLVFTRKTLT